jgi:precorrin-6Y C5,15-methyltransferase (decarboxylating)
MRGVAWLSIVGIGEDGWNGIGETARTAVQRAEVIAGGRRHLDFLPQTAAQRIAWPSPMLPFLCDFVRSHRGRPVCIVASGDPMLYGVGATLAGLLPASEYCVYPHVSAFSLACARMGWPGASVALVSAVARPLEQLLLYVRPRHRIVVYSQDGGTPAALAGLLVKHGYGSSTVTVLERLGGPHETIRAGAASSWDLDRCADLNVVAIECVADDGAAAVSLVPGLPDDAYEHDGQITKRDIRAATLARLGPLPGELLWDVGAGSGSIGIEWMRAHPACACTAFEQNEQRSERIKENARRLGVPALEVLRGRAPEIFPAGVSPDAIFVGGGAAGPDLLDACWNALRSGGRLVASGVTLEAEAELVSQHARRGGELIRLTISHAGMLGSFRTWRPQLPITQWTVTKA